MAFRTQYALWLLVTIECAVIGIVSLSIFQHLQRKQSSREVVIRLQANEYIKHPSSQFPHYFEPKANERIVDTSSWLPKEVIYTINADTLHERMDYPVMKAADTYRIVTLGDSFTYGLFVNTQENYSEQLEDLLNERTCINVGHFDVINLGVPAYDVGFSMERFRVRGQKYAPDMVIWFMNQFTMGFLADYKMNLLNRYMKEIPPEEIRAQEKSGQFFYPGTRAYRDTVAQVPMGEIIGKEASYLSDFSSLYQGPLVIVANKWDFWHPLARLAVIKYAMLRPSTWLFRSFPSLEDNDGLLEDGHPNAHGHRIIASNIRTYIVDRGLLPCGEPAP